MFRPIRRKAKEIDIEIARSLLESRRYGVLAMHGDDGYPYCVPINYLYDGEKIYFHGARAGHKYDSIKANPKVCFTVCGEETIKDEPWAPHVQSVVVFGRCYMMDDVGESIDMLRTLAMKYYPSSELVDSGIAKSGTATQMYVIEIEHISGKQVQER